MICQHMDDQGSDDWMTDFRADFSTASPVGVVEGVWVRVDVTDSKGRAARILISEEEALHLYRVVIGTRAVELSNERKKPL